MITDKRLTIGLVLLLLLLALFVVLILSNTHNISVPKTIRVACVGDSITQSSGYPYELWKLLGANANYTIGNFTMGPEDNNMSATSNGTHYAVGNFGAGSTTVLLSTETPYMNSSAFKNSLDYQPNIVVIMLGTNDAQPNLEPYNSSFVADYCKLVLAFKALDSNPKIWIVLPPPIFSNQSGKIDPEYFKLTIIPYLEELAAELDLPLIDVYSALINYPDYFPDGVHPSILGAKTIAKAVYEAIT